MIEARQVCRNRITTITTSSDGLEQRVDDGLDGVAHEDRRIVDDVVVESVREILLQLLHRARARRRRVAIALEPGSWKIGSATAALLFSSERSAYSEAPSSRRATSRSCTRLAVARRSSR